ncbi:MAG: response regulator [Candidatus Omnitrophica bacterium]|nr:response regulator [Candidatus Omnitrophota bacterium]
MQKKSLVMIVDDEKDLVDMIAYQFKARGYETTTAANGLEALEQLTVVKPDLMVLDLNMPKMGGIDLYQKICGPDGKTPFPILVLTARANMEQLFRDLEVDGFMAKPFDIETLIHEAEIIINKHHQVQETGKNGLRSVYVIDNDPASRNAIALSLLNAGYKVACAANGTLGLELIAVDTPTLALVRLGLADISGDLVALKSLRMAKTAGVKFLLYDKKDFRHIQAVRQRIGDKSGIAGLVEFDQPEDIVETVNSIFKEGLVPNKKDSA